MARPGPTSTLVVFSTFATPARTSTTFPHLRHYTDYTITSADGTAQQTAHNNTGLWVGSPDDMELPVGTHRVVAHANGYGMVTVLVVIRAN